MFSFWEGCQGSDGEESVFQKPHILRIFFGNSG